MGVANSKRVYSDEPDNENKGSSSDTEGAPEGAPEEAAAEETGIDAIKKKNMKLWKPYISGVIDLYKDQIERIALNFQSVKNKFKGKEIALLVAPDDEPFISKKIYPSKDDIKNFSKGSSNYEKDLIEYVDKEFLMKPELKTIEDSTSEDGKSGMLGSNAKKLKKDVKAPAVEDIFLSIVAAAKAAKRHKELLVVLTYVRDSDTFKAIFKQTNIKGTDESVANEDTKKLGTFGKWNDKRKKDKLAKKTGNAPEGAEGGPPPAEEGAPDAKGGSLDTVLADVNENLDSAIANGGSVDVGDSVDVGGSNDVEGSSSDGGSDYGGSDYGGSDSEDGGSNYGGSDSASEYSSTTYNSSGDSYNSGSSIGGSDYDSLSGGDDVDGGGLFKTAEEKIAAKEAKDNKKAYKDMKKDKKKDIAEKKKQFFLDTTALNKFMDEKKDDLLGMYESNKVMKNVKKDSPNKLVIATALLEALNKYEPGDDTAGAAGQGADKSKEGDGGLNKASSTDPAEGDKAAAKPAEGDKAAAKPADDKGAKPAAGTDAKPAEGDKAAKPDASETDAGGGGGTIMSGGGKVIEKRKKKYTHKKPQRINININVGNDNSISDTSSSDSSSSSDEDEEKDVVVKHKKRKNITRRHHK